MCIYIPHWIIALVDFIPFVLIGGIFGFFLGVAWEKADVEYEEEKNGKNKKSRL